MLGHSVLRLSALTKRYPGVRALDEVNFDCRAGEVHALLGENGSGKSTLMKIASGVVRPDAGTVEIGGQSLPRADARMARALGLASVYQDDSLVLEMSVAQNLFLATARGSVPYAQMHRHARSHLHRLGIDLAPDAIVATLTPAQRQFLEIGKALQSRPKVLLLDEPTSTLDADGVHTLTRLIRELTTAGTGIVYVSHRLPEILALADRVSILRDGVHRGTHAVTPSLSEYELVNLMAGRTLEAPGVERSAPITGKPVLAVTGWSGGGFHEISLTAHAGEILGLAGAEGNGQREMLRALVGLEPAHGRVHCNGQRVDTHSPRTALAAGVLFLSSDRRSEALFPEFPVRKNLTPSRLHRISRQGLLSHPAEDACARQMQQDFGVVASSLEAPVIGLSGGNQQKTVLARVLSSDARVILIDEPTQGVDAGARFEIYRAIRDNIADDRACIINSSDAQELARICDRVLVFSRGRIVAELSGAALNEQTIVAGFSSARDPRAAAGYTPSAPARPHARSDGLPRSLTGDIQNRWGPLLLLALLTSAIGGYAALMSDAFLGATNTRHVLLALAPAALAAMAQFNVLLVRGD